MKKLPSIPKVVGGGLPKPPAGAGTLRKLVVLQLVKVLPSVILKEILILGHRTINPYFMIRYHIWIWPFGRNYDAVAEMSGDSRAWA
jgi:hypothetical protein